jgi:hypothetical protein
MNSFRYIDDNSEKINYDNLIESKKQVLKNNYWNEEHENILVSLQKSSYKLSKEYQKAYFKLKTKLQWYRIPIIIISAMGGFLSLSNSGYIPPAYNKWISLFVGFTNLMVTIISLIENFKKIDSRMNGSYSAHLNFQKLHDEISVLKRIPPNERDENGFATTNKLFVKYESFLIDAPVLKKLIRDDLGNDNYSEALTLKTNSIYIKNDTKNDTKNIDLDDIESQINNLNENLNRLNIKRKIDMIDVSNDFELNNYLDISKSKSRDEINENSTKILSNLEKNKNIPKKSNFLKNNQEVSKNIFNEVNKSKSELNNFKSEKKKIEKNIESNSFKEIDINPIDLNLTNYVLQNNHTDNDNYISHIENLTNLSDNKNQNENLNENINENLNENLNENQNENENNPTNNE